MAAMTVVVTRRDEVSIRDPVTAEPVQEVLRADQLLAAVRSSPAFSRRALAVPARNLLIDELPVCASVAEAPMVVADDTRVDDADDDVLAGLAHTTELRPCAVRAGQAHEGGSRSSVDVADRVLLHRQD